MHSSPWVPPLGWWRHCIAQTALRDFPHSRPDCADHRFAPTGGAGNKDYCANVSQAGAWGATHGRAGCASRVWGDDAPVWDVWMLRSLSHLSPHVICEARLVVGSCLHRQQLPLQTRSLAVLSSCLPLPQSSRRPVVRLCLHLPACAVLLLRLRRQGLGMHDVGGW